MWPQASTAPERLARHSTSVLHFSYYHFMCSCLRSIKKKQVSPGFQLAVVLGIHTEWLGGSAASTRQQLLVRLELTHVTTYLVILIAQTTHGYFVGSVRHRRCVCCPLPPSTERLSPFDRSRITFILIRPRTTRSRSTTGPSPSTGRSSFLRARRCAAPSRFS